jgi:hypothetical protein
MSSPLLGPAQSLGGTLVLHNKAENTHTYLILNIYTTSNLQSPFPSLNAKRGMCKKQMAITQNSKPRCDQMIFF